MKKSYLIFTLATIILVAAMVSGNLLADCKDEFEFFHKSYGPLVPLKTNAPDYETIGKYELLTEDRVGIECAGGFGYYSDPKVQGVPRTRATIGIAKYSVPDFIKSDLIKPFFAENSKNEKKDFSSGQMLSNTYISGKRQIVKFGWISNNIWILVDIDELSIKDEFLNDYLTRYPPTVKFSDSDFTRDSINRSQMKKYFQIISDAEAYRATQPDRQKFERFIGIVAQCHAEAWATLYGKEIEANLVGDTVQVCPITMNFNATERKAAHLKLRNKILAKTFDYELKEVRGPEKIMHNWYVVLSKIVKELKMTEEDIKQVEESEAPEQFKMSAFLPH